VKTEPAEHETVSTVSLWVSRKGKPLKRFLSLFESRGTGLKPGVNESSPSGDQSPASKNAARGNHHQNRQQGRHRCRQQAELTELSDHKSLEIDQPECREKHQSSDDYKQFPDQRVIKGG
jgi:hypothetical protein